MPEFLKRLFRKEEKALTKKVLDYSGLQYLIKRITESVCDQLLTATSSKEWSAAYLNKSMAQYKNLVFLLMVQGNIKATATIPVKIVQSGKVIEMACPVDFGEVSVHIYYYTDTMIRVKTSMASVEIWGTN